MSSSQSNPLWLTLYFVLSFGMYPIKVGIGTAGPGTYQMYRSYKTQGKNLFIASHVSNQPPRTIYLGMTVQNLLFYLLK